MSASLLVFLILYWADIDDKWLGSYPTPLAQTQEKIAGCSSFSLFSFQVSSRMRRNRKPGTNVTTRSALAVDEEYESVWQDTNPELIWMHTMRTMSMVPPPWIGVICCSLSMHWLASGPTFWNSLSFKKADTFKSTKFPETTFSSFGLISLSSLVL